MDDFEMRAYLSAQQVGYSLVAQDEALDAIRRGEYIQAARLLRSVSEHVAFARKLISDQCLLELVTARTAAPRLPTTERRGDV